MTQRIYIQLGALGDILNLLPLLWHDAQSGQASALMVAKKYADLLDGCSYLIPLIFDGEPDEIGRAFVEAQQISTDVKCCQVNGPVDQVRQYAFEPTGITHAVQDSFAKEAWRLAGKINLWGQNIPLVFDQRDEAREKQLCKELLGKGIAPVVVAVDGASSPFGYKALLLELLKARVKRRPIIDIGSLKAERFYDLIGLYEKAHFLVASDSAPLHLARAVSSLPVIALVNDKPTYWHGSPWRPNHIFHCRYGDFPKRAVEMLEAIESIHLRGSPFFAETARPNIIHVWSEYEERASAEAVLSWQKEYPQDWVRCQVEPGIFGRDSRIILKDAKRLPYLKDVIRTALMRARAEDIICLTRGDTLFPVGLSEQLKEVSDSQPLYAHRIVKNLWHPTPDLFAFTPNWWKAYRNEVPDLILGKDHHWPRVLMEIFKAHGAVELRGGVQKIETPIMEVKGASPRIQHNETLANKWLTDHNVTALYPSVTKQVLTWPLNRRGLSPFGYNGAMIAWQNRRLLAYRWHRDGNESTALAMAELDEAGNVKNNLRIEASGRSAEDPRLFIYRDELWCSYVESTWPEYPPKSIVRYGRLIEGNGHWKIDGQWQLAFGKNDGSAMEKNWLFFTTNRTGQFIDEKLFCIYANGVVLEIAENQVVNEFNPPACYWPWGDVKGGAIVPWEDGLLLRIFHSRLDNEPAPYRSRYYVGAIIMRNEPPFDALRMSKEPIIYGSEDDDLSVTERATCAHRKPKVAFPMGAVRNSDEVLLSLGINDCACAVARIWTKDLNL